MSGGEVIKSFLVGLGFGVDETSLGKFNKAISSASTRVLALYGSVNLAAAGIFASISKISQSFEDLGYEYRIIAPAINKALILRNELLKAYRTAGINIRQTIVESVKFNFSLAKTKFALDAIYKSVGAKFIPLLTKQMDVFRKQLYANLPKIQGALEKFVKFVFKAFEATAALGARIWSILQRVYDFFYRLHEATSGWSTIVIGLIAAWRLLNLAFLATPLGLILTGLLSILALYDDFKTFQEGGKSLFNWGPVVPFINAITDAVSALIDAWKSLFLWVLKVAAAIGSVLRGDFSGALIFLQSAANDALAIFVKMYEVLTNIFSAYDKITQLGAGLIFKWLSGVDLTNVAANAAAGPGSASKPSQPLGTNVSNQNQSNVTVNQQTSINVSGTADANATGKAVAGQQGKVNFDITRNLSPRVQ